MKTYQLDVLFRQRLYLLGDFLQQLVLLKGQVTIAELAFHGTGKGPCVLHHHVFRLGVGHGAGEIQRQLGANLVPVHGSSAGHTIECLDIPLLK
jgi:hypothetical protein